MLCAINILINNQAGSSNFLEIMDEALPRGHPNSISFLPLTGVDGRLSLGPEFLNPEVESLKDLSFLSLP